MTLITLLEQMAANPHFKTSFKELIENQPEVIQKAFLNNDSRVLKNQFEEATTLADRSTIFLL